MENPRAQSASKAGPGQSAPDDTVGEFYRGREIGRGSYATVYLAQHQKKKNLAAIKAVQISQLNRKLKENLEMEIRILKTMQHPHVVSLFACTKTPMYIYLAMEYCPMSDLARFMKKRSHIAKLAETEDIFRRYPSPPMGGLNEVLTRHFLKQMVSALRYLRGRNMIHRDIKPQNLLLNPPPSMMAKMKPEDVPLTANERALIPEVGVYTLPMLKIADFGFARHLPSTSLAETLCGTPLYMAPEILSYRKYDARVDLWSIGSVLHEMVTGKPPFRAQNHVELLRKIEAAKDVITFDTKSISISTDMQDLIRKLLKFNPDDRLFENLFAHPVVVEGIPGLLDEDKEGKPAPEAKKRPVLVSHATAPAADTTQSRPATRPARNVSDKNLTRSERERTAQDLAFEKEYVVVEKRAVEVNAFADELNDAGRTANRQGVIVRRATTGRVPTTQQGASFERRYAPSPKSATNMLTKAMNAANLRLFGPSGTSPPMAVAQYSLPPRLLGEGRSDEDEKVVRIVEEAAHRSDVVFGFAEVKYKQLLPATPSATDPLGIHQLLDGEDKDNTLATVGVAEEALVLYVKTLAILAKTIDLAGQWWNRGDPPSGSEVERMNNVVQWTRSRFNECLEKSEIVGRKLQAAQRCLPSDHYAHPDNVSTAPMHGAGQIMMTTGVTAEKLMFERAVEMSRSAAVSEVVQEDLSDCEIGYVTAIMLWEAVLESDDEPLMKQPSKRGNAIQGMKSQDWEMVVRLIDTTRRRLASLRKKAQAARRSSVPAIKAG
ncbi:Pkinase-domain-containing protein [Piedraia hortae CBS 480.64]|uniref:non-specific serine/threonine protein kinase n=1 Tax=Piedraia hortae CBS 480.64 TaxID=1314780 RepID=A0A6A7BSB9_9PEZI|nr:Pkinase-domain-containing protein [Piedraia hortae CBS 480.64]